MAAGSLRWTRTAMQVQPSPAFESLRNHAPHLLLSELQRALLVSLTQASGRHLQGLAQGAKCMRHKLGNRVTSKLRLVDDACHLLTHLTPESCTVFLNELQQCLTADADNLDECKGTDLGGSSCRSGDGDPVLLLQPMPPPIGHAGAYDVLDPSRNHGPAELEPDSLEVWWADARIIDPAGEVNELEASPFVATDTSVAAPIPATPMEHHAIGIKNCETAALGFTAPGNSDGASITAKTKFGVFEEADLLEEHGATDVSQITQEHVAIIIHEPHDEDFLDNAIEAGSGAEGNVLDLCLTREGTFEHDGPSLADDGETAEHNVDRKEIIAEKPKRAAWADVHDNDSDQAAPNAGSTDLPPAAAAPKQQKRAEKRNRQRKNKLVDPASRSSEFEELVCFMHSGTDERIISSLYVSLLEIELSAKQCGHDIAILGCDCHKPDQLAQYEVMLCSNGVSTICQACSDYY